MKLRLLASVALIGLGGCGLDLAALFGHSPADTGEAKLERFTSEAELKTYLTEQATAMYAQNGISRGGSLIDVFEADGGAAPPPVPDGGMSNGAPTDAAADETATPVHSDTTQQEEGVQEGDIIKNDGQYLYVLARGWLRIVRLQPADTMEEVAAVELGGWGNELYVTGDRVVAIITPDQSTTTNQASTDGMAIAMPDIWFYQPEVEVVVVGVEDRADPQILSRSRMAGSLHASRMIENRLRLVIADYPRYFIEPWMESDPSLNDVPLSDMLPDISIEVAGEAPVRQDMVRATDHYRPLDPDGAGMTTLVSMDINAPKSYQARSIVGYPSNVYASTAAMYLTDTAYDAKGDMRETTDIYKFGYTDQGADLVAVGTVPGRVLNQYSMSEYKNYLRIATTVGPVFSMFGQTRESSNNVYVLEQQDTKLSVVGSVENVAPGETIYSARFLGDKGFLVTYRQIDPLFTLDMSDPTNPRAVGELEVPGVSTFITPMDENHLLTVGRHTDEFGFGNGVRLSVFDVSNFAEPRLAHSEVIGEDGAYSEAIDNPKAFTYYPEGEMIALPIEVFSYRFEVDVTEPNAGSGTETDAPPPATDVGGTTPTTGPSTGAGTDATTDGVVDPAPPPDEPPPPSVPEDYFFGLYVYRVTPADGFELLGRMSTARDSGDSYAFVPEFTRGTFVDQTVYAVTSFGVWASSVDNVESPISYVEFPQDTSEPAPMPVDADSSVASPPG